MVLEPVRRAKVYQDVGDQLRRLIVGGRLRVGERLPSERELAQQLGVSRASVREAIRSLQEVGLLESRQGEGTFVREVDLERLREVFPSLLITQRGLIQELFEVRKIWEPAVAAYAAQRATAEDVATMTEILRRQEEKLGRGLMAIEEDSAFHYTVAAAAGNSIIVRVMDALMGLLAKSREQSLQMGERPQWSLEGHRRILAAVAAHDSPAAYQAALDHVERVESILSGEGVAAVSPRDAPERRGR
ncbi:MAG: FadR/GntR family transcriptional regulator [Dehalococcoidia bacterium]